MSDRAVSVSVEELRELLAPKENDRAWRAVIELSTEAIACAFLYFALLHPEKGDELRETARGRWRALAHRVSVWQAIRSIRSLPEIRRGGL